MKRLSILAAALALATSADAAVISFSFSNPLTTTEINQSGNLGLFNSTLGTLTGASITVNGAAVFNFSGQNVAAQQQNANITSFTDLIFTTTLAPLQSFINDTLSLSHSSGIQNYAVGQTRVFGPFNESGSNTDNLAAILGSLQAAGGGTFGLGCQSLSGLTIAGGGGNINTTQATQAGCGAQISYTYNVTPLQTTVPEPGTLALVSLAMAGIGFGSRRRKG